MRPKALTLYADLFALSFGPREDTAFPVRGKGSSQNDFRLCCGSHHDLDKSKK